MPRSGADIAVAPLRNIAQLGGIASPAANHAVIAQCALMLATGIKRQIAAGGARRSGLGKSQGGEQQNGDRKPDQEEFMPPPDRVRAASARRARWAAVRESAPCVTPTTLHHRTLAPSFLRSLTVIPAQAGTPPTPNS